MEDTDFLTDEERRVDENLPELVKDAAGVTQAAESLPPDGDLSALGEFFKVLTDPTRLKILYALGTGALCVFDLSVSVGSSVSSTSHHLAALKRARLVKMRRDGRIIYYSLDDEHVKSIIKFAREHLGER
ncbi:MAG: metalloregulator ArsR/SmtB family transcription factor [Treponema sp.]|jgi:ArsR family transcriptional regulator|nr:metalloregulator ArsR/SmtB family transcription factor [Treponema sp.]